MITPSFSEIGSLLLP